jgi:di/tricarboxylate transporter
LFDKKKRIQENQLNIITNYDLDFSKSITSKGFVDMRFVLIFLLLFSLLILLYPTPPKKRSIYMNGPLSGRGLVRKVRRRWSRKKNPKK